MLVEFVGGSLNGQRKYIDRLFEYFNFGREIYYARAIEYRQLRWVYVWYECQNISYEVV